MALERLGDSRADAAYARATSLAPNDPLLRLNLAGRHARAGRLKEAVEEANVVNDLLNSQEKTDAQVGKGRNKPKKVRVVKSSAIYLHRPRSAIYKIYFSVGKFVSNIDRSFGASRSNIRCSERRGIHRGK